MSLSASDVSDAFLSRLFSVTATYSEKAALDVLMSWHDSSAPMPDHTARQILSLLIEVTRIEIVRTGDEEESDATDQPDAP